MAIDAALARALPFAPATVEVERGRLRLFSTTIGEPDPIHHDREAAVAAGHRDVVIPPSFYFSLALEAPDPFGYLDRLGVDLRRILHGEQSFEYHSLAYAGDRLTLQDRITDVYVKRGGALEFVVKQTEITRDGEPVADMSTTIVVRNPEAS